MSEPLFEIENWRGAWYYKFGSLYTGPFRRRDNAVAATQAEVDPLIAPSSSSLRASLASQRPANFSSCGVDVEKRERIMSFGMSFMIPGVRGYA